ncbi:MAG: thioredoxin [Candidatus Paceibacterota bacterium]
MAKAIELKNDSFQEEVIDSDLPVLVDFWAPWCQPCLMMAPILDQLAEEIKDSVKITKLNVDEPENQEIAAKYEIQGIPNMKLFKNGEIIKEFVGLRPKEVLKQEIEKELA